MTERLVIVGAGAAGLCAAWHARRQGVEALVVDAAPLPGGAWAAMDPAMRCVSARHRDRLPDGSVPEAVGVHATAAEVLASIRAFAVRQGFRSRLGQRVRGIRRRGDLFELDLDGGVVHSRAVIAATGTAGAPLGLDLPGWEAFAGSVCQSLGLTAQLDTVGPRVLVVGAGNSGAEAVDLLVRAGRSVVVSSRRALRSQAAPTTGLGGQLRWMLSGTPAWLLPPAARCVDVLPPDDRLQTLVTSGAARLVGEATTFAPGGLLCRLGPGAEGTPPRLVEVDTVVVATGFRRDLDWLGDLVPRGPDGVPIQRAGLVPSAPGLALLGLPCMRTRRSGFLRGFDGDARSVVRGLLPAMLSAG